MKNRKIAIAGGGLVGSLLAKILSDRGYHIDVLERRPDPREKDFIAGRSINLALSHRGIKGLAIAGEEKLVDTLGIAMEGRMIHQQDGECRFSAYGKAGQAIYSISRGELNKRLLESADRAENVTLRFSTRVQDIDTETGRIAFLDATGKLQSNEYDSVIGTDGAYSAARLSLMKTDNLDFKYEQRYLDHGYKELEIPASTDGSWQLERNCLHIWPRKQFMLIALPNLDGSFTCTLFLAHKGPESFENLKSDEQILNFFSHYFEDAMNLMPDLLADFKANPTSSLVSMLVAPWQHKDKLLLMGDAAHAIVPFYGQGMNAGFEDCRVFTELLEAQPTEDWTELFQDFYRKRKSDADAIMYLAEQNFIEMRDLVADPHFIRKSIVDKAIAAMHPEKWQNLYGMVTFSDLTYNEAMLRGKAQNDLLEDMLRNNPELPEKAGSAEFTEIIERYLNGPSRTDLP